MRRDVFFVYYFDFTRGNVNTRNSATLSVRCGVSAYLWRMLVRARHPPLDALIVLPVLA